MKKSVAVLAACGVLAAGCEKDAEDTGPAPFESRYQALPSGTTLITGATVLTGTGERLDDADILIVDGKISAVGKGLAAAGADVVDASGKWAMAGI